MWAPPEVVGPPHRAALLFGLGPIALATLAFEHTNRHSRLDEGGRQLAAWHGPKLCAIILVAIQLLNWSVMRVPKIMFISAATTFGSGRQFTQQ
jgi:hypothetical protein